jgi:hypothetical protein
MSEENKAIQKLGPYEKEAVEILQKFEGIKEIVPGDNQSLRIAMDARRDLYAFRRKVQDEEKALKEPLNDLIKQIRGKADEIVTPITERIGEVKGLIKAEEDRREEEKRAAEEKERQRVAEINKFINDFENEWTRKFSGAKTVEEIDSLKSEFDSLVPDSNFLQEFETSYGQAHTRVENFFNTQRTNVEQLQKAQEIIEANKTVEKVQEQVRADNEKMESERAQEAQEDMRAQLDSFRSDYETLTPIKAVMEQMYAMAVKGHKIANDLVPEMESDRMKDSMDQYGVFFGNLKNTFAKGIQAINALEPKKAE